LANRLKKEHFRVKIFSEPTKGKWGQKIRNLVKHGRDSHDELRWFVEDRKEDVQLNIKPALENNMIIIMDRYFYSSVAYQGALGIDPDHIMELNAFAPRPNLCFILDCDPNEAFKRIMEEKKGPTDYFEKLDNLYKVRQIFLEYFKKYPEIKIISVLETPKDTHEEVWKITSSYLKKKKKKHLDSSF
ncbi:MAG: dTMP kinase, partial [Candidatus Hodarchaeota archaeon]